MFNWFFKLLESLMPQKKAALERPKALIKARPASLEQNYLMAEDGVLPDEAFSRLRSDLFQTINDNQGTLTRRRTIFKEAGRLPGGRPYFFLQPADERGFLFERTGSGWVVSRADKIIERGLFLRDYEVIDQVNLFYALDGRTYPRVRSVGPRSELLSFAIYEQRLKQTLGLAGETRRV